MEVALHRPRRHVRQGAVAEQGQTDGVPLAQHQVGEGGRQAAAVAELADRAGPTESHRAAGVDQEIGLEVGLLLVALDVEAVGLGQGLPVEVADRVARHVRPVLGELDREPVVGGPVQAGDEPLDDETGDQVETAQTRHRFGIEKGGRVRGGRRRHRDSGPEVAPVQDPALVAESSRAPAQLGRLWMEPGSAGVHPRPVNGLPCRAARAAGPRPAAARPPRCRRRSRLRRGS